MQHDGSFIKMNPDDMLSHVEIRCAFPGGHTIDEGMMTAISGSSCSRHLTCKVVNDIVRATPKLPALPDFVEVRQTRLAKGRVRYDFDGAFVTRDLKRGSILGVLDGKPIESSACGQDGENSDMTLPLMTKTDYGWLQDPSDRTGVSIRCRPGATRRATWVHYINSAPLSESARYTNCFFIGAARSERSTACLLVLNRDVAAGDELYTVYGDDYPLEDGADGVVGDEAADESAAL